VPQCALEASHGRMARPEPSSNRAPGSPPGDASSRRQTSRRYLKGAFLPIGGLTSGFPHQGSLGSGGHGVPCGPTMFTKQVSGPVEKSGSPIVVAEAQQVDELEERPGHAPDPRFPCPTGCQADGAEDRRGTESARSWLRAPCQVALASSCRSVVLLSPPLRLRRR
jgi:hypothetical protein